MKTLVDKAVFTLAVIVSAGVLLTSAILVYWTPGGRWPYAAAIAIVCASWMLRLATSGKTADEAAHANHQRQLTMSILLAASLLGLALLSALTGIVGYQQSYAERASGVLMGVTVMFFANVIPKRAASASGLALRRVLGWTLVLGGLAYALAWLLLPLDYASDAAMAMLFAAVIYAISRAMRHHFKQRHAA